MLNKKVLNFLLNVKHTVVDDVKIFDDDSVVFYVHPTKGEQCRCGICGRKAPYYDASRGLRLWRTTDIGLHKAEICADSYRVNCPEHGVVAAAVPWARHNLRYTLHFEQTVAWLAMDCSKVALVFRLDEDAGKNNSITGSNGRSTAGFRLLWNSSGRYAGIMGQSWRHWKTVCQTHGLKR